MERKFGGAAAVDALHRRLDAEAAHDGLSFRFAAMRIRPSTLYPHALVQRLQAQDVDVLALVQRIFRAHFVEARNIGLPSELAAIALDAGLPAAEVREALERAPLRTELDHLARAVGAASVPIFIIDRRLAISGAQPSPLLAEVIAGRAGKRA